MPIYDEVLWLTKRSFAGSCCQIRIPICDLTPEETLPDFASIVYSSDNKYF